MPGAWARGGTHLHSLLGQSLSSLSRVDMANLSRSENQRSIIHPSRPSKQFIPLNRVQACSRACACLFVVLVGLVCVPTTVLLHVHLHVPPIYDSSQLDT